MCKLRDIVIFTAGAEFFHTLSHIILPFFITLPIDMHWMVFTSKMNFGAIGINALLTIALLWWAHRLK